MKVQPILSIVDQQSGVQVAQLPSNEYRGIFSGPLVYRTSNNASINFIDEGGNIGYGTSFRVLVRCVQG